MIVLAGAGVGVSFGLFGAGGSAFATPVLALLGVPPAIALASPLPAILPSSMAGAREYARAGLLDKRIAKLSILAGLPAVIVGAAVGKLLGGDALLLLSGVMLLAIGVRMLLPSGASAVKQASRADRTATVVVLAAGAAFLAGMLANGGGFLLVPLFVVGLGFTAARAAGTALVAAMALVIPTLFAHWAMGNIDWMVAGSFALGMIPASMVGARYGTKLPDGVTRTAFGCALVLFSVYFLVTRLG